MESRASGYRSCYLVTMNCGEDREYRVEVQVRTKLQHLWSTAVEAAGVIYDSDFKTEKPLEEVSGRDREIRRFFTIVLSLFALEEGTSQVKGYRTTRESLVEQLKGVDQLDDLLNDLSIADDGVFVPQDPSLADARGFYLLRFISDEQFLEIKNLGDGIGDAVAAYDGQENRTIEGPNDDFDHEDVVLAYAESIVQLKLAFPNYSAKVGEFLARVKEYV